MEKKKLPNKCPETTQTVGDKRIISTCLDDCNVWEILSKYYSEEELVIVLKALAEKNPSIDRIRPILKVHCPIISRRN